MKASIRTMTLLAVALAAVAPAHAQSGAACTFEGTIAVSPGVTPEPHTTTFTTGGETGTIDCTGIIGGGEVTGPGTIGFEGIGGTGWLGGETCAQDTGYGTFSATIPTGPSETHIEGLFTSQRFGVVGVFTGSIQDLGTINGTFQFTPTEGDCVNDPITESQVTGQALIAG